MIKASIAVLFIFVLNSLCFADFLLTTKDGQSLVWSDYEERDGNYCTWKYGGNFCIPKDEIVSVEELKGETPRGDASSINPGGVDAGSPTSSGNEESNGHASGKFEKSRQNVERINERMKDSGDE